MQPPPSSVPPPGYPQPPARKGMPTWGWVLIGCIPVGLIAVVAIVAAILFPVFARAREKARQISCASNLKQLSVGMMQYAQDNDEIYPTASAWMDKTNPYIMSDRVYHCPVVSQPGMTGYGYAFNSKLGGNSLADVAQPRSTATLYDSTDLNRNATDAGGSLPAPGRHLGSNNIAYADGHVERPGGPGM